MLIQDIKPPMIKSKVPVRISGKIERTGIAVRSTVRFKPNQKDSTRIDRMPPVFKTTVTVRLVFTVNGTEYTDTPYNREIMDAYMHTGDPAWLKQLEVGL